MSLIVFCCFSISLTGRDRDFVRGRPSASLVLGNGPFDLYGTTDGGQRNKLSRNRCRTHGATGKWVRPFINPILQGHFLDAPVKAVLEHTVGPGYFGPIGHFYYYVEGLL